MRDLQVVELVENVLVSVLSVEPDEVVPHATLHKDLGARPADVITVLDRLRHVLPYDALERLTGSRDARHGTTFAVEDLVDLVEAESSLRLALPA